MYSTALRQTSSRSSALELDFRVYRRRIPKMARSPCCSKEGLNRGAWTAKEDMILSAYIQIHGDGGWRKLPKRAGLNRSGASCRLRWVHYLRPDIKRGNISPDEEELIIRMHRLLGNRWSLIAGRLPGRTDNEIKNYWKTHLKKKVYLMGQDKMPANLKTRAESRPPLQNGGSDHAFKMCNIQETANYSKSCCDIFANGSIPEDDSELMAFCMADANLVETEVLDQQSLHSRDQFAGNSAATIDEILCDSNNLYSSDPDCNQSVFSIGFGSATLDEETNEFELIQSNMQQVNSITLPSDQGMKEFYDSTESVDWNHVLNYILN